MTLNTLVYSSYLAWIALFSSFGRIIIQHASTTTDSINKMKRMAMMNPSTPPTKFPELEIFEPLLIAIVFGLSLEKGISWVLMEVQTFPNPSNSSSITANMQQL